MKNVNKKLFIDFQYNKLHFGENNNEFAIDVDKLANELLYSNLNNYQILMNNLNYEILGDHISDEENIFQDDYNIDKEVINKRNKNYTNSNIKFKNTKLNNNTKNKVIYPSIKSIKFKSYTDVHANSKFHYPTLNDSFDNMDQFAWNDRSNRNKYYSSKKYK